MSTKQFNITKWIILGGGIATIVVAVPVLGQYAGLSVDIVRAPARQTNDEQNFQKFREETQQNFQRIFDKLDKMESGMTNRIIGL